MTNCITHHYACGCREEKTQTLSRRYLQEHHELQAFKAGFGKIEDCRCEMCKIARELLKP